MSLHGYIVTCADCSKEMTISPSITYTWTPELDVVFPHISFAECGCKRVRRLKEPTHCEGCGLMFCLACDKKAGTVMCVKCWDSRKEEY